MGTGIPAMDRLTICIVMCDVEVTAPVLRLMVPVVGPLLMKCVVAVTGMNPNCLNESVASGRASVALTAPVLAFTFADSLPGPRGSVAFGALRKVLPVTLYVAWTVLVAADVGAAAAATLKTAARPTVAAAAVVRMREDLTSLICHSPCAAEPTREYVTAR